MSMDQKRVANSERIPQPSARYDTSRYHFWYSTLALATANLCIVCGAILFLNGITGHVAWASKVLGLTTQLNDAAPGVVFVVVGFLIICVTRFRPNGNRR